MATRWGQLALLILIVGAIGSCRKDKPIQPQSPPEAPDLFSAVAWSDSTITLAWHDRSSDEDGFYLRIQVADSFVRTDAVAVNTTQKVIHQLSPGTTYRFRLTAFNEAGESDSVVVTSQTTGNPPPLPPTNVQAVALDSRSVRVTWTRAGTPQNYLISRRQDSSTWSTISTRPASDSSYTDTTVAPINTYYYRVGAKTGSAISWSADSAFANTPDGPPAAPDSLGATVLIGYGVTLSWKDHSSNETGFHISRSSFGQLFAIVDSTTANDTSWVDILDNQTGDYSYRVRAFNVQGFSAWSDIEQVHYDICSAGIIPLCVGNWWEYAVLDTVGADYSVHREVIALDYPLGLDYYLMAQWVVEQTPTPDTLDYLRNYSDGCWQLSYPLSGSPAPQRLYKYPAQVGQFYFADGDCVLVAGTGVSVTVNQVVYSNCYVYQRYYTPSYSIQIYIKPETVGIVREDEFVNAVRVVRRDVTSYGVQNH